MLKLKFNVLFQKIIVSLHCNWVASVLWNIETNKIWINYYSYHLSNENAPFSYSNKISKEQNKKLKTMNKISELLEKSKKQTQSLLVSNLGTKKESI